MELLHFLCPPPKSPFAPQGRWVMAEEMINGVDYSKIASIILSKEKEIIESTQPSKKTSQDGYTGLGPNSLTSRYESFNVFEWDDTEIQKLRRLVKNNYLIFLDKLRLRRPKVWIQCWANVLRKGQKIEPHLHDVSPYSYLGGHVTVQCDKTSTVYINPPNQITDPETHESENKVGKLTLFQNSIPHYTSEHVGDTERITIAFDIVLDECYKLSGSPKNCILFDEGNM